MTSQPVLLVTGGGRGIGAATARLAAARGYSVGVNYRSDEKSAAEVVRGIAKSGGKAVPIQGDMAAERDVARVIATLESSFGRLSHLVYSSGVTGKSSRVEAVESTTLREVIDVNVLGALLTVRAAIPRVSKKHGGPGGAIVLLSSVMSDIGGAGEYVWYAASKGAIDSMTYGLARELAADGIRVNAVSPGAIDTGIHAPGRLERVVPNIPMARAGQADEIAEAIAFLLSDASSYTTGTILKVSGGR